MADEIKLNVYQIFKKKINTSKPSRFGTNFKRCLQLKNILKEVSLSNHPYT